MTRTWSALSLLVVALLMGAVPVAAQQAPSRQPLLMEGKKTLFQRVLTRPGATLQSGPAAAPQGQPVDPFSVFYVYGRQGTGDNGWVEVGRSSQGPADGWISAGKTIDWKQTLTVAFTNPAGRERVLFFRSRETAQIIMGSQDMGQTAGQMRQAALTGMQGDGPVLAVEPENFVDITRNFYLLPILSAQETMTERGDTLKLLEVASIPSSNRPPIQPPDAMAALKNFTAGLVFVVDTTKSMDPYIDRTREAIRRVYGRIGDTAVADKFRFGMVVYRNSVKATPALEYVTKVVASIDPPHPREEFLGKIDQVKAATVSSSSYYEDPFAGLKTAIDLNWDKVGGRYIILITDAGGRASDDPLGETHLGPAEIRELAQAPNKKIAIFALHLQTPAGRNDHARARDQYTQLTQFENAGSLYYPIPNGDVDEFGRVVDKLTNDLLQQVATAVGVPIGGQAPRTAATPAPTQAERRAETQAEAVGKAMRLAYLGREQGTAAPDVFRAWAFDRDLANVQNPALDVRLLITKNQLSDLQDALKLIYEKGVGSRLSPDDFFSQLKTAALAASRDPRRIGELDKLGNVVGEYLDGLPYRSKLMEMTPEEWRNMGSAAQREFLNGIEAKLRLYHEYDIQRDLWVSFDNGRVPGDAMFPMPLEALP